MAAVVTDILETRLELVGLSRYVSGITQAAGALGLLETKLDRVAQRQLGLAIGFGATSAAIVAGLGKAVIEAGKFQQLEIGFKTLLGSAEKASDKLRELQEFAAVTPFRFEETARLTKQLVAMGISASDAIPVMRDLGDATSALGLGDEALSRIVFNFGQIKTLGKVTMREIRDFAMNGIPVFEILREEMGLTKTQLQNIGEGGLDAEKVLDAFRRGLQKRYGGSMEAQNKSLAGSFSNLQDEAQRAAVAIGKPFLDPTVAVVRGISGAINKFNEMPANVKNSVGIILATVAGALGILAIKTGAAVRNTVKMAMQNVALANAAMKAGGSAGHGGGGPTSVAVMNVNAARVNLYGNAVGGGGYGGGSGGTGGAAGSGRGSGGPSGGGAAAAGAAAIAKSQASAAQKANAAALAASNQVNRAQQAVAAANAASVKADAAMAVKNASAQAAMARAAQANAKVGTAVGTPAEALARANAAAADARAIAAQISADAALSASKNASLKIAQAERALRMATAAEASAAAAAGAAMAKSAAAAKNAANMANATVMNQQGKFSKPTDPTVSMTNPFGYPNATGSSAAPTNRIKSAMGKTSRFVTNPKVTVAAILAELGLAFLPEEGSIGVGKRIAQGALTGAGFGALGGTLVGQPGAGAIIGGVAGGGYSIWNEWQKVEESKKSKPQPVVAAEAKASPELEELRKIKEVLEQLNKKTSPIGVGEASAYEQARYTIRALGR